jgi:hypothetical protein
MALRWAAKVGRSARLTPSGRGEQSIQRFIVQSNGIALTFHRQAQHSARQLVRLHGFGSANPGLYASADYRAAANAIPALGHDASMCETPQVRHSKIYRSGKPPNRFVLRTSFIRLAQLGQSGGVGVELLVCSSPISGTPY